MAVNAGNYSQAKKLVESKLANKGLAAEVAAYEAELAKTQKTAADTATAERQTAAATVYKDEVDATLDPVAQDFKTFGQLAQVSSNVDPAFRQYQLGLAQQLQQQANGQGPSIAQLQLQQATDRTLSQSLGQIRAATGANAGLSARTAALAGAQQLGATGNASGQLRLQEQMQAQQLLGQIAGQGRQGDLQANDQSLEAQIATGNFKTGALNGLAGIRTRQAAPSADIYGSNATDTRQAISIQAEKDMAATRAAEERAAQRRQARAKESDRIWGAAGTVLGAAAGSFLGPAGTAAGATAGGQLGSSTSTYGKSIA